VTVRVAPVPLDAVRELRHLVLRPHQPAAELTYAHDEDPDALHLGAVDEGGAVVAVASVTREPPPGSDDTAAWRLRGMATLTAERGRGIGGRLLESCLDHARERGGTSVWCNARTGALAFYERHGFVAVGEPFDLPDLGPHLELRRASA
jgi:predicted GNAT family N-acyltransferase